MGMCRRASAGPRPPPAVRGSAARSAPMPAARVGVSPRLEPSPPRRPASSASSARRRCAAPPPRARPRRPSRPRWRVGAGAARRASRRRIYRPHHDQPEHSWRRRARGAYDGRSRDDSLISSWNHATAYQPTPQCHLAGVHDAAPPTRNVDVMRSSRLSDTLPEAFAAVVDADAARPLAHLVRRRDRRADRAVRCHAGQLGGQDRQPARRRCRPSTPETGPRSMRRRTGRPLRCCSGAGARVSRWCRPASDADVVFAAELTGSLPTRRRRARARLRPGAGTVWPRRCGRCRLASPITSWRYAATATTSHPSDADQPVRRATDTVTHRELCTAAGQRAEALGIAPRRPGADLRRFLPGPAGLAAGPAGGGGVRGVVWAPGGRRRCRAGSRRSGSPTP